MKNEFPYNPKLWITVRDCDGKHFLATNPHTSAGQMSVWCPVEGKFIRVTKSEIETMSDESKYWVEGYLHGNQPKPAGYYEGEIDTESAAFQRWQDARVLFVETGYWSTEESRQCSCCGEKLLASQPGEMCKNCISKG